MEVRANAVYTGNLKAGSRMFFFDVRKASSNNNYLVISETSKDKEGNKKSRMRVVVENFQFLNRGTGMGQGAPSAPDDGQSAPAPQAQRQPFRPQGRPAPAAPAPQAEMDPPSMEDEAPQVRDEDIPF